MRGVIAASAGNHALGLAYHGKLLNVKVTLVMPTTAPITKVQTCISHGAQVVIHGSHFGEAMAHALALAAEEGTKAPCVPPGAPLAGGEHNAKPSANANIGPPFL